MCPRQFRDVFLGDLENLILQLQIESCGDNQASTRKVGGVDVERRRQFVYRVIGEMRREAIVYYTMVQKMRRTGFIERDALLQRSDISLQGHQVENMGNAHRGSF